MFLSQITIKNFRGIKSLDLTLADTAVLISIRPGINLRLKTEQL
jgi:predicted ATP-dependent endonuclease of OLD family